MREYGSNINLPSLDNLFSSEQERQDAKLEKIQILPLTELHPFRNHPFQVRDDDEMDKMVDSIKEYGVMTPAIVRPRKDGGYEIVAGHRRCHASQRAGVETMPCIVRDMDDDTAIILMVDSNCQREHMADEYLSGNVREKLRIAHVAADQDPAFRINVEALEQVQPKDLTAGEITVRLGVTWIGPEIIKRFADELFQSTYREQKIAVRYNEYLNNWYISNKSQGNDNIRVTNTYGTKRINGYHLLENALNLRATKIYDTIYDENGKEQHKLNGPATEEAQAKQRMIEDAFKDWIFKDRERRESLVALYNEKFNCIRPREYDGSHIQFFGMNPEIALRPHQRNAIAHILYGHNTLLAHVVGAGKTYEMVAAAMEKKRLGLCSKTLVAVPNHLTGQFASEALKLYPNANILVTTQRDFEKSSRKRFCAKIATGNYDLVVIGHSQFEKIPLSDARKAEFIRKQIDELEMQLESMDNSDSRLTVKQLESKKKQLKTKLSNLLDAPKRDDVVTFEELGADSLMVDEAHNFKNLMTVTKMHNIAGISTTESQKASDLFMKCQYLDEITGARGVTFATGTPISNSMTELYTMQRYLQQYTLERNGLANFDSWAATFGETVTAIELAPEGYTLVRR